MMRRTIPLVFAALGALAGRAQEWTEVARIPGPVDAFTTDELGHLYVRNGDVLDMYDANGRRLARNSAKTFGMIDVIDAFYSLKPMVFSRQQRQIAMLDNTLAVQGSVIDLARNGYPWVTLVCAGVQNAFWCFDERGSSLTRIDAQLRPMASTGRLDQVLGHAPEPIGMVESNSRLYVNDPAHGVLVFDLFGAYLRTLPITGASMIEVKGDQVFFFRDGHLSSYDPRSFTIETVPVVSGVEAIGARIERDRAYVRTKDGLVILTSARK